MNGSRSVGLWDKRENGGEEGEGRMMSSSKRWWDDRIHVCRHRVKQGVRVEVGIGVAPWCVWRQRGGVVRGGEKFPPTWLAGLRSFSAPCSPWAVDSDALLKLCAVTLWVALSPATAAASAYGQGGGKRNRE